MKEESFAIGSIIGGTYKILDFVGQGGMGQVFKVEHVVLAKIMAMKVLLEEQVSSAAWQRFRNEAQAIARLDHANIIRIYDMSQTPSGLPFYTMDFLSGQSLADKLDEDGRISMQDALPIFEQVCIGLGYAHDRGIIHRDIKPGNIMLLNKGEKESRTAPQVKIVDFGIAKLQFYDSNFEQGLTKPGEVCGSPLYMSPEQSSGQKVDYRTDMYSVGVSMYQALTGRPPLLGKSAIETIALHQNLQAPLLSEKAPDLFFPSELEDIVACLLHKDPEQRYSSLYDAAEDLKSLALGPSATGRQTSPKSGLPPAEYFETTTGGATEDKQRLLLYIPLALIVMTVLYFGSHLVSVMIQGKPKPKDIRTFFTDPMVLAKSSHYNPKITDLEQPPVAQIAEADQIAIKRFIKQNKDMYRQLIALKNSRQTFHFPDKFSLGKVYWGEPKLSCEAQGTVQIPARLQLALVANLNLQTYPSLLKFFYPGDLNNIAVHNAKTSEELARNLAPLKGLNVLDLNNCEITDKDLGQIDKLPDLLHVILNSTKVTAQKLVETRFFYRVNALEIEHLKDITPVLKSLVKSRNIKFINIGYCNPTTEGLSFLAKSKTLTELDIHANEISAEGLALIATLKLNRLKLHSCSIKQPATKTLEQLAAIKSLKGLIVPEDYFSLAQIDELKRQLPATQISTGIED